MPARTGAAYLAGLRDGREVWFGGERVADVTTHPRLGRVAHTLAALYDLQTAPAYRERLTYPSPASGQPVSLAFIQPRGVDDLVRRRHMFQTWAEQSGGMLGRTPDYLNAILTGFASAAPFFARNGPEYAERVVAYYEWCREHDPCATHTLLDPQSNRARTQTNQPDPTAPLHVVGESAAGLVVSGARTLATLAPYADELLVYPSTSRITANNAPRYAFAFAVPVATPGLKFICRQSLDPGGNPADHPLAARFEEMDAVAVFHEVVVPWERVFLQGDPALCNALFRETPAFYHGVHQFTAKNLAKAEFVLGVAALLAEAIGRTEVPTYQMMLGEIVDAVETLRAYLRAAEVAAVADERGYYVPNPNIMATARSYFPKVYPRLVEILQLIGSSGLMATPTEADLAAPELAADVEKYYQGATLGGHERVRLFRLAWDVAGSDFGGRQVLYERFFGGDPWVIQATRFTGYDRAAAVGRVRALLARQAAAAP
ncbi:MAG TPA: 4-hydroxyphenylacetate 3-monooxygenase, oxygenase component [Chloroflexota bacterium]|nr:4-hydroxyphenylacetate 3-monooxygenase, oxygenase component [Chloroflexota bacterium]